MTSLKNADSTATGGSFLEGESNAPDNRLDNDVNPAAGGHKDREIVFLVCGSLF